MKRSGFPGQRLEVLPGPRVRQALDHPVLSRLLVTDCGYFPQARGHGRVRPHGSPQTILIVCTAGRGKVRVGDSELTVGPGDTLAIRAGTAHAYTAHPDQPWTIWWVHVTGADADALVDAAGFEADRHVIRPASLEQTVDLIRQVIDAVGVDDTDASLLSASGAAWHLLASLRQPVLHPEDTLEMARTFILEHLADPLTVEDIADHVHLSPSHLAAVFKAGTGMGPITYQGVLRMRRARQLLDSTTRSVTDVAASVGYADPAYFSRRFRQLHELSPRQYRSSPKG
ncbi:MAG: AraC family transcriptional regulator [Propionibacteriaceae bacterium]|nr:AraC family transcriptional regulator [Micropruina sp.]